MSPASRSHASSSRSIITMKPFAGSIAPWTNIPGMSSPFIASFALFIQIAGFRCCCEEWESIPLKWWVNKLRNESAQLLRRIEAAQCLQGCGCLRDRRLAFNPNCHAGFPIPGNSELGGALGHRAGRDRIPNRTHYRLGLRAHSGRNKRTEDVHLPSGSSSKNRTWIYVAVIGAAISVGLFFIGRYTAPRTSATEREHPPAVAGPLPQKSIAVLPLLNESGDPKDEYFSDGLSEELIAALAQIRELKVIGRSSSFRFKERKEEPKTIGEKLGVATLLEGTVRKQGDRVRIVAELINAADGIELWTRTFDRELKDIFAVQQEIAAAVASSLKVTLLGLDERSSANPKTAEAHNAYLQGHYYFQRRNLEDYRKAVGHYDEAIRLDPEYALAYAERSEAWTLIGDLTGEGKTAWPKARTDAEKAVAIAPALAEAHSALGWVPN